MAASLIILPCFQYAVWADYKVLCWMADNLGDAVSPSRARRLRRVGVAFVVTGMIAPVLAAAIFIISTEFSETGHLLAAIAFFVDAILMMCLHFGAANIARKSSVHTGGFMTAFYIKAGIVTLAALMFVIYLPIGLGTSLRVIVGGGKRAWVAGVGFVLLFCCCVVWFLYPAVLINIPSRWQRWCVSL